MTLAADPQHSIPLEEQVTMCIALSEIVAVVMGKILYPYNRRLANGIIEAVLRAEGDEILTLQARQSGKTEAVINAIITLSIFFVSVLNMRFECGLFAPAKSQAISVTRARMRVRMGSIEPFINTIGLTTALGDGRTTGFYVIHNLQNGLEAQITSLSADKTANIKGETLNLIILEQVEDVNDSKMKNDIFPMGAAVAGVRVLSGTSTLEIRNEYFYDRITMAGPDEAFVIAAPEAVKFNPKYKLFIEKEKIRLGENSLEYRAQYLLEWGTTLIHFIEDRHAFLALTKEIEPSEGLIKVAGWDPARMNDYSVVTIMEGVEDSRITDWWYSQGTNLEEQIYVVIDWLQERGVSVLAVDAIGLGVGVCDMLENHLPNSIKLMRIDMNAKQQDEMFKLLDREIKTERFHYPKAPSRARDLFLQQMLSLLKKFSGRYLLTEAPKGKGRHDDFADSLALAMWGLKGEEPFKAGVESFSWRGD